MSGGQILNIPWVWYSHNKLLMIKMLYQTMTQRWTQATGLVVMIGECFPDSQLRRSNRHPANVGCSFFKYTNGDLRNHTNQRRKLKTSTRDENQLALHCNFRINPTQKVYRKRMIESWQEYACFQTSQRLADNVRTKVKKG